MIRSAKIDDFNGILDLCEVFWKETVFKEPFERSHVIEMVNMAYDHKLLCVIEEGGKIEGFAAGVKSPLLGNSKVFSGTELAWWVNPSKRKGGNGIRLLKFMEDLAREAGIKYWSMVSMESSMPEQVSSMYERMGYKLSENVYMKVI